MKVDEGQALYLQCGGFARYPFRVVPVPGSKYGHQDSGSGRKAAEEVQEAVLARDVPCENVANHLSNHRFFLQERVVPKIGRDSDGPPPAW